MGLFNLNNNLIVIDPSILVIPEFKTIWNKDKSKQKDEAQKALSFVYFMTDFDSPYANIPDSKREQVVLEDFIKDPKWSITSEIQAAMNKYKMLTETPAMRLVLSTRRTLDKLCKYMDEKEDLDDKTARAMQATIKEVANTLSGYAKMEEYARKEQKQSSRMLGDRTVGHYER